MNFAEDQLMALRKLYYCAGISLLSDSVYDQAEAEFLATAAPDSPVRQPGSDRLEDYDPAVRALSIYMTLRIGKSRSPKPLVQPSLF